MGRLRWFVLGCCMWSLLVSVLAGRAAAQLPAWRTGAHLIHWYGPDAEPLALAHGCREPVDIQLRNVVHDGQVWTWCKGPGFDDGALARIDLATGSGRIQWPLPAEVRFGGQTVGVYPGPGGLLGIVWRTGAVNGPMATAVAGADGWQVPPRLLPGGSRLRLLGGAWVMGALELVIIPTVDVSALPQDHADRLMVPTMLRVRAEGFEQRRPFADRTALCGFRECNTAEVAQFRRGSWFLAVTGRRAADQPTGVWWVSERGKVEDAKWDQVKVMPAEHVDLVEVGLAQVPALAKWTLQPDGTLGTPPEPPGSEWTADSQFDFDSSGQSLRRRASWRVPARAFTRAQRVDGRVLTTESAVEVAPPIISVAEYAETGEPALTPVAHEPAHACGDLSTGTFVSQPGGGLALFSKTGCYILLDAKLQRSDPLTLWQHLSRRGSQGHDWNEKRHAGYLLWALFGLPVCVVVAAWLLHLRRKKGAPYPKYRRLLMSLAAGALVHGATAFWCYVSLLPLLS